MKRLVLVTAAMAALASCATKPPTMTEMLVGTWNCDSKASFGSIKGTTTYTADGKGIGHITVVGSGAGMAVEATGDAEASWKLLEEDTKFQQSIDKLTVTAAKLNGNTVDPKLAQTLLAPFLGGQSTTATIKIDPKAKPMTLTLVSTSGDTTNCTRPAKT